MTRLVTGIQPTGSLHIGNYFGAIKQFDYYQNSHYKYESFCFIADLHAITIHQDPKKLHYANLLTLATLIACGIDTDKTVVFKQSDISQHTELAWILGCSTNVSWLNKMTQFKDKGENDPHASLGLYSYPVLMAADILLYKAEVVPVGNDQHQHLQLANDIAKAFNRKYKIKYFKLPKPQFPINGSRIMSLNDGTKKMSKSDESDYSRINLTDTPSQIENKILKAKTDNYKTIGENLENRPDIKNLVEIYNLVRYGKYPIHNEIEFYNNKDLKDKLAHALILYFEPITKQINDLMKNQDYLKEILEHGATRARYIAEKTILEVKEIVGF